MLTPGEFSELVSGRRRGVGAALLRGVLRMAEGPYTLAVNWRNRRYDRGRAKVYRAEVPVVSVGNLTLGGTGKTPMVQWIARRMIERGVRVAIVSRGYGAAAGDRNDEARELQRALPSVPQVQNPDRIAAVRRAVEEFGCQAVLLDDGFQHRRLGRDLDIVLLDAFEPFGLEHVFPRGTLREPVDGLQRADVVCLSRSDAISAGERAAIQQRVAQLAPQAVWCEVTHAPSRLANSSGAVQPLSCLMGRRVVAFCGIGNPAGFRHTLAGAGCQVAGWREFPDHHGYSEHDFAEIADLADRVKAEMLVCTQKDLVKVEREQLSGHALWALAIEMQFLAGEWALEQALKRAGS